MGSTYDMQFVEPEACRRSVERYRFNPYDAQNAIVFVVPRKPSTPTKIACTAAPLPAFEFVGDVLPEGFYHGDKLAAAIASGQVEFVPYRSLLEHGRRTAVPAAGFRREGTAKCIVLGQTDNNCGDDELNAMATALALKYAGVKLAMIDRMKKVRRDRETNESVEVPNGTVALHLHEDGDVAKLEMALHNRILADEGGLWAETSSGRGALAKHLATIPKATKPVKDANGQKVMPEGAVEKGYVRAEAEKRGRSQYPVQATLTFQKPQEKEEKQPSGHQQKEQQPKGRQRQPRQRQ